MTLRVFPVLEGASYTDDFAAEEHPGARKHLGNDLFAPHGTPLLAVDDGEVHFGDDVLGGNIANLYADDGTRYYYAHLSGFAGAAPRRVRVGETIGFLGTTGNAAGTPAHTHFEVHPDRGAAVDPFPYLRAATVLKDDGPRLSRVPRVVRVAAAVGGGLLLLRALAPDAFRALVRI